VNPAKGFHRIESIYSLWRDSSAAAHRRGRIGAGHVAGKADKEAGMPQVKVRRRGISAEDTAAVIRDGFPGQKLEITPRGDRELEVSKSFFVHANVSITDEPGGTVFNVRGGGPVIPLLFVATRIANNRGIARRVAEVIGAHDGFRDDA
jgi:hypothetical protein